jgi:hypothetical protein
VAIAVLAFAFADGADLHISAFLFAGGHVFENHGCLLWLERGGNNLTHGFVIVKAALLGFGDAFGGAVEFEVVSEVPQMRLLLPRLAAPCAKAKLVVAFGE